MPSTCGKGLGVWYLQTPCENRFDVGNHKGYICAALKEGCFGALRRGVCPKAMQLPVFKKSLPIAATEHTVTFLRDIPAGTYRLVKEG